MPELPEVETIVSDLRLVLPGKFFDKIVTSYTPALLPSQEAFEAISGVKVMEIFRQGKYIKILFENEMMMTIHLRMSGRLIAANRAEPEMQYERTRIDFGDLSLRFCDLRKFGKVWITSLAEHDALTGTANLGIEPFSEEYTFENFKKVFSKKKGPVKRWLLDQGVIAGIGNIYADESCFYTGITPDSSIENLDEETLFLLFESVKKSLKQGIKNRGTSISDYADAYGKSGKNQELLFVYGRGGKPCLKCETVIVKTKLVGRGTAFCPTCQERK